jgi:type IV pilus assembly protein PilB
MPQKKRLGEILIEAGIISEEQLEKALHLQQGNRKLLGQILVEMGWATEQEVCRSVAKVLNMDYASVDNALISQEVVQLVSRSLAAKHNVLPLIVQDKTLYLAMENSLDNDVVQQIEENTGMRIKPLIAPPIQLQEAVQRHYNVEEYVGNLLGKVIEDESVSVEQMTEASKDTGDIGEIRKAGERDQIRRLVNLIVANGIRERASAIHIESTSKHVTMGYKIDGMLTGSILIPKWLQIPLISTIKELSGMGDSERDILQNERFSVRYAYRDIDLLVSMPFMNFGESLVIRILDQKSAFHHINRLGLSSGHQSLCRMMIHQPQGWIIGTGPPGCGKTTTLYALLNAMKDKKIVTLENPVEYPLDGVDQFQINPRVEQAFARGVHSLLQQRSNVIFIGEIRDAETAALAVQASETGHVVLSPMYASDTVSIIRRLFHLGIPPDLVASNLLMVVAQRLVRRICPECKTKHVPTDQELQRIGIYNGHTSTFVSYKGGGCKTCKYTGYYGQTGIYEILAPNDRLREEILRCPTKRTLKQLAIEAGMKTMLEDGIRKIQHGITTLEEVIRVCAVEQAELEQTIQCPRCGKKIMQTESICPFCRSRLYEPCEQCGAELEQEWTVCPFCGAEKWVAPETSLPTLQKPQTSIQPNIQQRAIRIVVAENNEPSRKMVTSLLEQQGYEVVTAANGEDALGKIRTKHPNLVILAVDMPKGDGFSVCKALRSNVKTMFMPVIMLTERNPLDEKLQGISFGANEYITKPFEPDGLLTHVKFVLHQLYEPEKE